MKFSPVGTDRTAHPMRLPERRYSLIQYFVDSLIPDILKHDGANFCSDIIGDGPQFVCDLYNEVWDKYAQERPFELADFRVFEAYSQPHGILFVSIPGLPGMKNFCPSAFAIAYDSPSFRNSRMYKVHQRTIDNNKIGYEVYGPNGRVGCTPFIHKTELSNEPIKIVDLIWQMAFDEKPSYELGEIEDCAAILAEQEMMQRMCDDAMESYHLEVSRKSE